MVGALVTSNFSMSHVYPANAVHAPRSRRLSNTSHVASSAARIPRCTRKKKSTSPPKHDLEHLVVTRIAAAGDRNATPRPAASLAVTFCNALEEAINTFIDPPALRLSVDPRHVLSGNFAPVDELPPTPCPVVRGSIPRCLAGGAYIRNGPNPQHPPRGPHHLFDGDGMLHSLLLPTSPSSSRPVLCSRYVHTYKYLLERNAGEPVLPNILAGFHGVAGVARVAVAVARALTGQMSLAQGVGVANTSLAFFGDRLYALAESDLPYAVRVDPDTGDVTTHGSCDLGGHLRVRMTAHPKMDPITGELFAFRYGLVPPFLTYFRFDSAGNKAAADVPISSLKQPHFLHDFAVTERYAIFPETQMVIKPMDMVMANGALVGADLGKVPRLGVLPRYATDESEMRWFQVPGFNMVHAVNAWEEAGGEELVLVAPNMTPFEHVLDRMELVHACVEMVRINLRTGTVSRTPLSAENLELGVIHPGRLGRRNLYGYFGVCDPMPRIGGVAKLDFGRAGAGEGDCTVARRDFGPGCFAREPLFVPDHVDGNGNEDDGYVVCYVHNEATGDSRFVLMDARSPDLDIVAEVQLPTRVPYGFHGLFITQAQLRSMIQV
ncbi:unnamed protein product [Alopecurus aequalis]